MTCTDIDAKEDKKQAGEYFDPYASKNNPTNSFLIWHGDEEPKPVPMLVEDTFPMIGIACVAGQFSSGKTFVAFDLAASVMMQNKCRPRTFFGKAINEGGGVLFLAAEGYQEVTARLEAALSAAGNSQHNKRPFAKQRFEVPTLTDPASIAQIEEWARAANDRMLDIHRVPLRLIIIDTVTAAAGFENEDRASETQRVYGNLATLAKRTQTLVLVVDHYGKAVETGIRGSSAKAAALDAILAITVDGETKTATLKKTRSGPIGRALPFTLRPVPIDDTGRTTCVVEWSQAEYVEITAKKSDLRPEWRGNARLLKRAVEVALIEHGEDRQPYSGDPLKVRAVPVERIREEFCAAYGGDDLKPDTKRRTFVRLLDQALSRQLLTLREIAAVDWVWFAKKDDEPPDIGQRTHSL